ncbi:hypothetical protein ACFPK1_08685 [Actinomycetospora rhizophila]|uniref:DUF4234 domain-containing protein n=2 Tax=Actinomycetospora TaxID=402649 RepID=A0ABV9Z9M5_9PSEU|nr:hypothetical protein [Actinomycetospora chibensis]MDD7923266.1 hypothetical protein [Actinomycetospora chibensis]
MWTYALAGAAYVFMALWVVSMWRLRKTSDRRASRDRDLSFSVAAGVLSVITAVTAIALLL